MQSVVVNGCSPSDAMIEIADTVSVIQAVKHAFKAGVKAQKGVEF